MIWGRSTLLATVELTAGDYAGKGADWWAVADTLFGWYYYHVNSNTWRPGFVVSYQGPLFDLAPYQVLNMSGLSAGTYTLYFGVDMNMNGSLDMGDIYYDSVEVEITP